MQTSLVAREYCESLEDAVGRAKKEAKESTVLADSWRQRHAILVVVRF